MPRSATTHTRRMAKRCRKRSMTLRSVATSAVLPGHISVQIGQPSPSITSPKIICFKSGRKSYRERELELTFAGLVELATVESRANDVQLGLLKCSLHTENKAVVELGGVVTTILVDYQRAGDGAQLQQTRPILVGARQA